MTDHGAAADEGAGADPGTVLHANSLGKDALLDDAVTPDGDRPMQYGAVD